MQSRSLQTWAPAFAGATAFCIVVPAQAGTQFLPTL